MPPKMNRADEVRVNEEIQTANGVLEELNTETLKKTNELILAGVEVVYNRLGLELYKKDGAIEQRKRIKRDVLQQKRLF